MPGKGREKIYVIDEITAKPGQAEEFLRSYMEQYAPGARNRGMHLEFTWVTPPVWLKDKSNTLFIVWSVQGAAQWWGMSSAARNDEGVTAWWKNADAMISSRHRSFASAIADIERLSGV